MATSSRTDEALHLLLDNGYRSGVNGQGRGTKKEQATLNHFTGGRAAGGCGKYGGWSDDGLVRFNELIALVRRTRRP
jgi:hypothetical protein